MILNIPPRLYKYILINLMPGMTGKSRDKRDKRDFFLELI
jgi:hypothetical protein